MSKKIGRDVGREAVRLRVELQLSTPEIARRLHVSNFVIYNFLKKHPWAPRGKWKGSWTAEEIAVLTRMYPSSDETEIVAAIPKHKWVNICKKANSLDLKRPMPGTRKNKRSIHPVIKKLRQLREQRRMTRPRLSEKCGYHINEILHWELGQTNPKLQFVSDWAAALGFEIVLQPILKTVSNSEITPLTPEQMMVRRA